MYKRAPVERLGVVGVAIAFACSEGPRECRTYATALEGPDGARISCALDNPSDGGMVTLACDWQDAARTESYHAVTSYPGLAAFVRARQPGLEFSAATTVTLTATSFASASAHGFTTATRQTAMTYDGGVETSSVLDDERALLDGGVEKARSAASYTAWDADGRPARGVVSLAGGETGDLVATYDDAAHTVARVVTASDGGVLGSTRISYDEHGNWLSLDMTRGDFPEVVWTTATYSRVVRESSQICVTR